MFDMLNWQENRLLKADAPFSPFRCLAQRHYQWALPTVCHHRITLPEPEGVRVRTARHTQESSPRPRPPGEGAYYIPFYAQ